MQAKPLKGKASIERMRAQVKILRFVQRPFGWIFWALEQRISRIQDRIANGGDE